MNQYLASGVNATGDIYELTFKTDLKSFNALQIEALTHPSLPRNGPGRGLKGEAIANELEVFCRLLEKSGTRPQSRDRFCRRGLQLLSDCESRLHGICQELQNKTHRKFHYFAEPLSAPENCEIVVRFKGNTGKNWGDRNLGCFRISVASIKEDSNESTRRVDH